MLYLNFVLVSTPRIHYDPPAEFLPVPKKFQAYETYTKSFYE